MPTTKIIYRAPIIVDTGKALPSVGAVLESINGFLPDSRDHIGMETTLSHLEATFTAEPTDAVLAKLYEVSAESVKENFAKFNGRLGPFTKYTITTP